MDTLEISFFANCRAQIPRPERSSFEDLRALLQALPIPVPAPIDDHIAFRAAKNNQPCWSPAIYHEGMQRSSQGVRGSCFAVIDLDKSTDAQILSIKETLSAYKAFGSTSFSSRTPYKNNLAAWRFVVLLDREVSAAEWPAFWASVQEHICQGQNDPTTKDISRIYFYGHVPEGYADAVETWNSPGTEPLAVDAMLDGSAVLSSTHLYPSLTDRPTADVDLFTLSVARGFAALAPKALAKAVGGEGRRETLFRVALALIRGQCLTDTQAIDVLNTIYAPACAVPGSELDLNRITAAVRGAVAERIKAPWGYLTEGEPWLSRDDDIASAYVEAYCSMVESIARLAIEHESRDAILNLTPRLARLQRISIPRYERIIASEGFKKLKILTTLRASVKQENTLERKKPTILERIPGLEVIDCGPGMGTAYAAAKRVAIGHEDLYVRGGRLVDSTLATVSEIQLMIHLSTAAQWVRKTDSGVVACRPDRDICIGLTQDLSWPGAKVINRLEDAPRYLPDGSILHKEGYSQQAQAFLTRGFDLPRPPESYTQEDAVLGLEKLHDLVTDFPFATDAARSAWVASVITPFIRPYLAPVAPVFLFDSASANSGKTTLARLAIRIAYQTDKVRNEQLVGDGAQRGSALISKAELGRSYLFLDEVGPTLGNTDLDALSTSGSLSGRPLYGKATIDYEYAPTIYATGSAVKVNESSGRRTLRIRLRNRPIPKTVFHIKQIDTHVSKHKESYMHACLAIVSAYLNADCPSFGPLTLHSFPDWERVVCGAIQYAGGVNPVEARADSGDIMDASPLVDLCAGWAAAEPEAFFGDGIDAKRLLNLKAPGPLQEQALILASLLQDFCKTRNIPSPAVLGKALNRHDNHPVKLTEGEYAGDYEFRVIRELGKSSRYYLAKAEDF